jgi:hypothetical protein
MAFTVVHLAPGFVDQDFGLEVLLQGRIIGTKKPYLPNPSQGYNLIADEQFSSYRCA